MLHRITHHSDPLIDLVKDDPVRPELGLDLRINEQAEIFVLLENTDQVMPQPAAVVCAAYRSDIPSSVEELLIPPAVSVSCCVFYTIWSYRPGAGRRLITEARSWINVNRSHIDTFVTLSPQTEMARKFHLQNGAKIYRQNSDSVNYIYP